MPKWNFAAMGQAGLTGRTRTVAQPVARSIARKTGRPEPQILSLGSGRSCRFRDTAPYRCRSGPTGGRS